ncbi:hypothetical protein Hanom_Chr03g00179331 [Helianthus anomalus]
METQVQFPLVPLWWPPTPVLKPDTRGLGFETCFLPLFDGYGYLPPGILVGW